MTTSRARHCGSFWFYWTVTGTAEACGPGTRRAVGLVPHAPSRAPAAERKGPQVCKGGFAVPQRGVTSDRSNGTGAAADADHCGRGAPAPVSPRFRAALSASLWRRRWMDGSRHPSRRHRDAARSKGTGSKVATCHSSPVWGGL